jgi:hypothetical protein
LIGGFEFGEVLSDSEFRRQRDLVDLLAQRSDRVPRRRRDLIAPRPRIALRQRR